MKHLLYFYAVPGCRRWLVSMDFLCVIAVSMGTVVLLCSGCSWKTRSVERHDTEDILTLEVDSVSETDSVPERGQTEPPQNSDTASAGRDTENHTDVTTEGEGNDSSAAADSESWQCGNGILDDNEACDDGNRESCDGCTADCKMVETGYETWCENVPGRRLNLCGDGDVMLPEMCDDGNGENRDGCSANCQIEPGYKCEGSPSVCEKTVCGDGKIEGVENCEDGNSLPFDGCSQTCQLEPVCSDDGCTSECGDGMVLAEECDDGNFIDGDGCSTECHVELPYKCDSHQLPEVIVVPAIYRYFDATHSDFDISLCSGNGRDMVEQTLQEWRPVGTRSVVDNCVSAFDTWFSNDLPEDAIIGGSFVLAKENDFFVGPHLERHFPIDLGDDDDAPPEFLTIELHYWQVYDEDEGLKLSFSSRDDLWVFVNGHLALDMGGIHDEEEQQLEISSDNQELFKLKDGQSYRISIFHANRSPHASVLEIGMSLKSLAASVCESVCGDGIVAVGEECDYGINDGSYGGCTANCEKAAYCGDGIVQDEYEECDDGNFLNGDECPASCRFILDD